MPMSKPDPYLIPTLNSQLEELKDIHKRFLLKSAKEKKKVADIDLLTHVIKLVNDLRFHFMAEFNMTNYETLSPFANDLNEFLENLIGSFTADFVKYEPVKSANIKKNLVINFVRNWEKYLENDDNQRGLFENFNKDLDNLLYRCADMGLHHFKLADLDEQIERITNIDLPEKSKEKKSLLNSLKNVRKMLVKDLDEQYFQKHRHLFKEVNFSSTVQFAQDTANLLSQINFDPARQKIEIKLVKDFYAHYEMLAKQEPRLKNFAKGIGALATSLGLLILGTAVFGFIGTILGGLPGGAVLGLAGGIGGALGGAELGKKITSMPNRESIFKHLFFQPTALNGAGMHLAKKTQKILAPIQEDMIDCEIPTQVYLYK